MTPRTPQCEVFWSSKSSSELSRVPEDSNPNFFQVLGFTPTLGQSRVATLVGIRIGILRRPGKTGPCCWNPVVAWNQGGEGVVAIAVENRLAPIELVDFLTITTPGLPDSVNNLAVLVQLRIALLF